MTPYSLYEAGEDGATLIIQKGRKISPELFHREWSKSF